jgi:hypothetical protein
MIIYIDEKTAPLLKKMLAEQNKGAVRIANCGVG